MSWGVLNAVIISWGWGEACLTWCPGLNSTLASIIVNIQTRWLINANSFYFILFCFRIRRPLPQPSVWALNLCQWTHRGKEEHMDCTCEGLKYCSNLNAIPAGWKKMKKNSRSKKQLKIKWLSQGIVDTQHPPKETNKKKVQINKETQQQQQKI